MIQKILAIFTMILSLITPFHTTPQQVADENSNPVTIYLFYVDGCSNCANEKKYLDQLVAQYDNLTITLFKISDAHPENSVLLQTVADVFNEDHVSTPFTVIGGKHYVGFNAFVQAQINKYRLQYSNNEYVDVMAKILNNEPIIPGDIDLSSEYEYQLPLLGLVDIRRLSLGVIAIVLGVVDGFNPCATWVLLFLIALLLPTKSKKKMILIGGTFLLISALFYFGIMFAWIETLSFIGAKKIFQTIIGVLALFAAFIHLKSYYQAKKTKSVGCEVTSETQKEKLMARVRRIVQQNNLWLSLVGTIALAIIVNLIELACSSGLPVIFSQILAINGMEGIQVVGLVALYVLFFLIDDLIIFIPVVITMNVRGISNRYSSTIKLIGGIMMLVIGILMLFFPNLLMFSL